MIVHIQYVAGLCWHVGVHHLAVLFLIASLISEVIGSREKWPRSGAQVVLCTTADKHMCSAAHKHKQETSPPVLQLLKDCQSGRGGGMESRQALCPIFCNLSLLKPRISVSNSAAVSLTLSTAVHSYIGGGLVMGWHYKYHLSTSCI